METNKPYGGFTNEELTKAAEDYFKAAYSKDPVISSYSIPMTPDNQKHFDEVLKKEMEKDYIEGNESANDFEVAKSDLARVEQKRASLRASLKTTAKKGLMEQISDNYQKITKLSSKEVEVDAPKEEEKKDDHPRWTPSQSIYKHFISSFDLDEEKSDYVKILKTEHEELKKNQKPKEWSDDLVLMDINRLTAFLLDGKDGMKRKHWFNKHKDNDLNDAQFELWDNMYNSLLKFRNNE